MSFLIADPVTVSAAAANLEDIGSALRAANLSSPTAVAAAAADEVSTAIAALFGTYAQDYRVLSAQAASFHARFVRALSAGAGWYASAEAVNGSLVQQVEQQALNLVNGPAKAMLGRPLFGNGADATVAGSRGADGGLIFGNGGNGAAGDNGQPGGAGGNAGWFGNGGAGGAGGAGAPGGNGGNGGQLVGNGGNGGPGGQAVAGLNGANPGLGGLGGTAGLFGHPGSNGQVGASATDVTPSQPPGSTDGGGGTGPGGGTGTGLDATYTVTSQWDTGYVAKYTVTNSGSTALGGWKVEFDLPQGESVTSAWGGQLVSNGTHYTVASEAGAQPIAPGQSFSVGFQVAQTGAYGAPTNAVVNGQPVTGGTTPTPPPVTPPVVPPVTPPPVPSGPTTTGQFSPYVDMSLWPQFDYTTATGVGGIDHVMLGFIVSDANGNPSWGTYYGLNDPWVSNAMTALQHGGADATISFGGAANQELALTNTNVQTLTAKYQSVIDTYGIHKLDFDIEGAAQADLGSLTRRSQAVAALQAAGNTSGHPVEVTFTLPVLPTGLTADGLGVITNAITNKVDIGHVNVMAMDYYDPNLQYTGHMGDYAIQAATAVHDQLVPLYPAKTDAQIWSMIDVTPMIGVNDDASEIFTVADAQKLTAFAQQKGLGGLHMWSADRDYSGPVGAQSNTSSGVAQNNWDFSHAFEQFEA